MKWIKVENELPDYDTQVLWYDEMGHYFIDEIDHDNDWYNFQECHIDFNGDKIKILYWMPLPEAPKY